jgi:tRNA(Ile)-lysidine synthase
MNYVAHLNYFWTVTIKEITQNNLPSKASLGKRPLLLAISGGLDSMCLLQICQDLQLPIIVTHVNYQLRDVADGDANLVADFCKKNNIPFLIHTIDTKAFALEHKMGTQEAARIIRYQWFAEIAIQKNAFAVVTAHHEDDNIETLLLSLSRGSGLQQLKGMQLEDSLINIKIFRPFLNISKAALLDYATQEKIDWREDASNLEDNYKRNAIRNNLLPEWRKIFPQIDQTLANNMMHWATLIDWQAETLSKEINKLCFENNGNIYISVHSINSHKYGQALLTEIARQHHASQGQIGEILQLLSATSGKLVMVKNKTFYRDRTHIIIAEELANNNGMQVIENIGTYDFEESQLILEYVDPPKVFIDDKKIAFFDAEKIVFPLRIRLWKEGDYFYPLGLNKKKKIARFCIDIKMPQPEKNKQYVVLSEQHIVWLLAQRIDHRFSVKPNTKKVLRITLQNQ